MRVKLGDRVKDRVTGVRGIAVAITEWLYGCVRVVIQPEEVKDGRPVETVQIDEPQLEVLETEVIENVPAWRETQAAGVTERAAGPRPDVTRNQIPPR